MNKKDVLFSTILIILLSLTCGIISKDYILGTIILSCGLLNSYYASIKKSYNYIFGAIYSLLSGFVCFKNGLYGVATLSFVFYFPSQIIGFILWQRKKDENKEVKTRGFKLIEAIIVVLTSIVGSLSLGYLLSKIPSQNLAFLDSSSTILNLCGIILMNLRYKEFWIVALFVNSIDVTIWIINTINKTENSIMMLLVSIGYLVLNIYGLIKWYKNTK